MADQQDRRAPLETIGIALATYNGAKYLPEMLGSFESQTHLPDIIAVSDDHSSDSTIAMMKERPDRFPYVIAPNPGKGVVANFENAMRMCKADFVALCDQDDAWRDDKLEKLYGAMIEAEKRFGKDMPILVFSDLEIVDGQLKTITPSFYRSSLKHADAHRLGDFILDGHIPGCAMLINRALLDASLPLPAVKSHDWWIQIVASAIGRLVHIDSSLILYRQHGNNTVGLGNFGGGELRALLRKPLAFLSKRHDMARTRAVQVRANIIGLLSRFDQKLSPGDRHMLETLLSGSLIAKLGVLDPKRVGMRFADYLLLLWSMSTDRDARS